MLSVYALFMSEPKSIGLNSENFSQGGRRIGKCPADFFVFRRSVN